MRILGTMTVVSVLAALCTVEVCAQTSCCASQTVTFGVRRMQPTSIHNAALVSAPSSSKSFKIAIGTESSSALVFGNESSAEFPTAKRVAERFNEPATTQFVSAVNQRKLSARSVVTVTD